MQLVIDIIGFLFCGFVGFVGGYLFRITKENKDETDRHT